MSSKRYTDGFIIETGGNLKTGTKAVVAGKHMPHFKAGKELKERVDT